MPWAYLYMDECKMFGNLASIQKRLSARSNKGSQVQKDTAEGRREEEGA